MDPFSYADPFAFVEFMKTQGNYDFRNGNYSLAIRKYDEALRVLLYLHPAVRISHGRDLAVLLCNRSNAFYNLNKWEEAFRSAHESIQYDPTYMKAYYRAGYSLIKLSRPLDATRIFYRGLTYLQNSTDVIQKSEFIVGIYSSVNNARTITSQFVSISNEILRQNLSQTVWQQAIEKLVRTGQWHACLLLAAEKDRLPRNLRVTNLSLKDLFDKYVFFGVYERMERIPKLVEWLISIGANIVSVGACPLHAVIKLCIKAKGNHLFKWLLDNKPELKALINQQDEDGSTLLHIVASQINGYSLKNQIEDVVMLLNAGVDPRICDSHAKSAIDIFKKNKKFKPVEVIKNYMERNTLCSKESSVAGQVKGESSLTLLSDAFEQFKSFCCLESSAYDSNLLKHEVVQNLLRQLSTVTEIPEEVVCDIPSNVGSSLIKQMLEKKMWSEVLLLLTRKATDEMTPGDGLVKNCDLSDLDAGDILNRVGRNKKRVQLIRCLIERGVSPAGTGTVHENPLQKCLQDHDFELAYLLLSSHVDPQCLSIAKGDTPLHAALSICFEHNDDIGLQFLSYLLDLYGSNPSVFSYLNPNTQDKNGNTVMHIIFQKGVTKQVKKMLGLLAKFDINFNLKNKLGRDVRYRKKKNDPVLIAWNEAVAEHKKKCRHDAVGHQARMAKSTAACNKSQLKSTAHSLAIPVSKLSREKLLLDKQPKQDPDCCQWEEEEDAGVKNWVFRDGNNPLTLRERLVQETAGLIQKLVFGEVSIKTDLVTPKVVKPSMAIEDEHHSFNQKGLADNVSVNSGDPVGNAHDELNESKEEEEATEDDQQMQEIEAHIQDFDNMTWEIECTSEMLKKLVNKSTPHYMRKKIIHIIQQLGNGEWTQSLQKRLKHLNTDIQLYEAKLDKGARMLWELAIDFSPRCSENAETIIEHEHSAHPTEKTGRVYTEIIRIWDIVLDHNRLDQAIKTICSAYKRGLSCILRKKLKGINTTVTSSNLKTQKRIPRFYVEDTKPEKSKDCGIPEYFPPASAIETEYNIMKFHSFSTNMALNIVSDMTSSVEYPFRVGELEYAIIDLNPKPLEPIILIGRSGTGKTTCCLYRLWKKFHCYWEKAESAGGPLLVRQMWRRLKFDMQFENATTEVENYDEKQDKDSSDSTELDTIESTDDEHIPDEDDQDSSGINDPIINLVPDWVEEEQHTADESDKLEHLHQIFITKNHVLCQEVQRNFTELSKSSKATSHFKPLEANVFRLQNVKDENFPLFLTSKRWLLLLDASMSDPFFLRNEDGSLKHIITGWSTKEDFLISDWQEDEEDVDVELDYDEDEKAADVHAKEHDPRIFVTYSIFANEIWPKMVKCKCPYNPALVWKEIKSFLKGSVEALSSSQGILTEEEYKKLGRKRSPNFKEDRSEIYQIFCAYQQIRLQRGYFDEEDILFNLSQRLLRLNNLPWCIHEVYGDEIQDFTQAELVLLMKCIDDPNTMFLTGDTAQSIMKGVAFRFSDLRSLFHYASKNCTIKKQSVVRKPKRIYQLYQNYRSHSGILHLASGVVDLLQHYFPESFDRLPRDLGLFDGPKPTVLESCSVSDLAILLRGNKRKTQPIEFGAHQVILVANDIAKEKIPEELSLALVLTVYEAKGLEFDDVLLYNFFTDSEAPKEWKIISSFIPSCHFPEENKLIIETPLEKHDDQAKPQVLNAEMYKMLNGELKQLYTAITRARVNLWIFDESNDRRAPAFQYFIKTKLVQVVKTDENKDLDDSMFVKTSTPEEWIEQGRYYEKHKCWKVAAKCYQKGGAVEKEKLALAHYAVLQVQSKKSSPKEKQMEYMDLAKTYLECSEPSLALKCLFHAKEYQLCAQLCEKLGRVKEAAYFYKRGQCYKDAFRCFEQIHEFDLALKMCCCEELYEEAAKCVERYEKILGKERWQASKLSYTASQFYLEAAAKYLSANRISEMMAVLSHLDTEDQLVFLKDHKYFSEAADLLKREGRDEEAAKLMKQHGFVLEAANLTNQKDFRASCLLAAARLSIMGVHKLENLKSILKEALKLCEETNQKSESAEAMYLMGIEEKDFFMLKEAFDRFLHVNHYAGAVEALFGAIQCEEKSESILRLVASDGIQTILNLVKAFQKADTNAKKEMVKSCFDYFGIALIDRNYCQVSQNETGCILEFLSECSMLREKKTSDQLVVSLEEVKCALNKYLLNRLVAITHSLFQRNFPNICRKFIAGLKCEDEDCEDFHRTLSRHEIKSIFQCKIHLATINGLLLEAKRVFPKNVFCEPNAIDEILTADKYALCKSLINTFFPKHFHLRMVSENPVACKQILSLHNSGYRTLNPCSAVLRECIRLEFKNETAQNRRESTDLWLRAMQVFALTSSYPQEFERLIFREEDEYNQELKLLTKRRTGRPKGVEGRYGMLMPDKYAENAESTHLCFIRLLQDSMDQLYIHRNIEDCRWLFYRFMNVLVVKCINPLIPSIGNTVALLEFQFVLGCTVLMRLCRSMTLCLPKSYIALVHYWDFLFRKGDHNKDFTYSVIQDYKPENSKKAINDFKKHLMYLADVLCGYENFNVLLDAFSDPDYITSGEAERTVVLCLVMLINADQVLKWKNKMVLTEHFPAIKESLLEMKKDSPSKVPERLVRIVDLMSEASEIREVVAGLKELLYCRDEEFLADCCWRWDPRGARGTRHEDNKVLRGIYYEAADLNRFACLNQEDSFEEPEMDFEQDVYVEERKDPLANIASLRQQKQQQKASAKRKLKCLFLFVCCCIQWKRVSSSKAESLEMASGVFKKADVDRTQCDLCGVKFLPSSDNFVTQTEDSEKEPTEATVEGDWEENVERKENIIAGETFESHVILDDHNNNYAFYQRYFDFFKKEMDPVICEARGVVESIGENMCIKGHFASRERSKLEQRKIEEAIKKISDMVEDIYKRKAWSDGEEAMSKLAKNLCANLDDARGWLKKTESTLIQEEEFDHDKDLDNEVKGKEINFEELHHKKALRKNRKRQRK